MYAFVEIVYHKNMFVKMKEPTIQIRLMIGCDSFSYRVFGHGRKTQTLFVYLTFEEKLSDELEVYALMPSRCTKNALFMRLNVCAFMFYSFT